MHADTSELGTWFCRGLWKHEERFHGGCNYWRQPWAISVADCEIQCTNAGYGDVVKLKDSTATASETEACKLGCRNSGGGKNKDVIILAIY